MIALAIDSTGVLRGSNAAGPQASLFSQSAVEADKGAKDKEQSCQRSSNGGSAARRSWSRLDCAELALHACLVFCRGLICRAG